MRLAAGILVAAWTTLTSLGGAWAQRRPASRVLPTAAAPPAAPPATPPAAPTVVSPQQQALDRGLALREQGRFREALAAFEEACQPEPRAPCVWYQIEAHDHLHQYLRAAELFPRYDILTQNVRPNYAEVRGRVMSNVGRLRVIPDGIVPPGVAFLLDGATLRGSQVGGDAVFVAPGERVVEARGDGREPVRVTVSVAAGADRSVSVPIPEERVPVTRRWWFWTAIGVAVAGGVTAAVLIAGQESPAAQRTTPPSPLLGTEFQVIRSVP